VLVPDDASIAGQRDAAARLRLIPTPHAFPSPDRGHNHRRCCLMTIPLSSTTDEAWLSAKRAISHGRSAIIIDDSGAQANGALVFAAKHASTEIVSFAVKYTSGFLKVALPDVECDRLGIPPMFVSARQSRTGGFSVTVDARTGISTGISAKDRAQTMRMLADPQSVPTDFTRPGHIVPVRCSPPSFPQDHFDIHQAALELVTIAGTGPATVVAEVISEQNKGDLAGADELRKFAAVHRLTAVAASRWHLSVAPLMAAKTG
jgi:3,4-dihydroxy 2-butanone 4-phosphate synthase / GTP cyclohydrolase II